MTYNKDWRRKNPERDRKHKRDYQRKRKHRDPAFKLLCGLRRDICRALNRKKKSKKTFALFGYTPNELKAHLESKFTEKMSWENYGTYWHIDHIVPISFFDFNDIVEFKYCWSFHNLRPFPAKENEQKSNHLFDAEYYAGL